MKINDIVFTTHAIERMKERGIEGDWGWQTMKYPDRKQPGKEKHTTEFIKHFAEHKITAIGKKNDVGEWVVVSVWMDPPLKGTKDYQKREKYIKTLGKRRALDKKMETAGFWGKLWLTFRKQTGF